MYVDGVPGGGGTIGTAWAATGPLTIGRATWNSEPANYLRGRVAGVRIWTRALGNDEIVADIRS